MSTGVIKGMTGSFGQSANYTMFVTPMLKQLLPMIFPCWRQV